MVAVAPLTERVVASSLLTISVLLVYVSNVKSTVEIESKWIAATREFVTESGPAGNGRDVTRFAAKLSISETDPSDMDPDVSITKAISVAK